MHAKERAGIIFSQPEVRSQSLKKEAKNNLTHQYFPNLTWPGIGLVWPWRQNTPFTYHRKSLLASIIVLKPCKYQRRCDEIANLNMNQTNLLYILSSYYYPLLVKFTKANKSPYIFKMLNLILSQYFNGYQLFNLKHVNNNNIESCTFWWVCNFYLKCKGW